MKIGDLVRHLPYADKNYGYGVITHVDNFHRQTTASVLFGSGLVESVWVNYLEVISEQFRSN